MLLTLTPLGIGAWFGGEEVDDPKLDSLVAALDTIIVLLWCTARRRRLLPLLTRRPSAAWLVAAFVTAGGTFFFASWFLGHVETLFDLERVFIIRPYREAGYGWGGILLLVCVQPAVIEELAFRGIILDALLTFLTRREAIVVSALMFASIHLTVFGLPQFLLGLILAWMRLRSVSLLPCAPLHFTHNLLVLLEEASAVT